MSISIHAPREGGDVYPRLGIHTQTVISIHAPREGGDYPRLGVYAQTVISIHAPREGGDSGGVERISPTPYFNPRPPRGGRHARRAARPCK